MGHQVIEGVPLLSICFSKPFAVLTGSTWAGYVLNKSFRWEIYLHKCCQCNEAERVHILDSRGPVSVYLFEWYSIKHHVANHANIKLKFVIESKLI